MDVMQPVRSYYDDHIDISAIVIILSRVSDDGDGSGSSNYDSENGRPRVIRDEVRTVSLLESACVCV